ncbi:MAG TPA: hypothetical protein VKF38_06490 [Anaerolineaceae bacterium]|nr:hypothetical protein [Anaerolineaceae bacterium]
MENARGRVLGVILGDAGNGVVVEQQENWQRQRLFGTKIRYIN